MPGEAMIQAAIQTLLQDTTLYGKADVTLGDQRVMGRGRQCAVIYPGPVEASRPGDWSQVTYTWQCRVEIWRPFRGDDYTDIISDRQTVVDTINANPTLGGVANLSDAVAGGASEPLYLWPHGASLTGKPAMVGFRIDVQVVEERLYAGSGEFT